MNNLLFISGGEIFVILVATLLVFGADKIPEIARGLGKGIRDIKRVTSEIQKDFEKTDLGKEVKSVTDEIKDVNKALDVSDNNMSNQITDMDKNIR